MDSKTSPPSTTTMPPSNSINLDTANAISSLLVPTTIMLWESCATVTAMAPVFIP